MDSIDICRDEIEANLKKFLSKHLPRSDFKIVYEYVLLPPGKLFRPLLARSLAWDFQRYQSPRHAYFELFVELHHAYTLVHDDLPSMDDSPERRGRLAAHKKFGEWKAILVGDGLNTLSSRALSFVESNHYPSLLRYCSWALGAKGLIQGQYQDLSLEINHGFSKLISTHKLKTSRLIQVALVGSALVAGDISPKSLKDIHRLGEHIGITFQLLDDLCELTIKELSHNESQINPFLVYGAPCVSELQNRLGRAENILQNYKLSHTQRILRDYLQKVNAILNEKEQILQRRIGKLLKPIQLSLHRLGF